MEEIQGGHCPCSKMHGGQPTTLPPPCRAPGPDLQASRIRREIDVTSQEREVGNSVVTAEQFGHLFLVCIKYDALQEVTCGLFRLDITLQLVHIE